MDIIKSAAQFEELCLSPIKQDSGCSNESDSDTSSQQERSVLGKIVAQQRQECSPRNIGGNQDDEDEEYKPVMGSFMEMMEKLNKSIEFEQDPYEIYEPDEQNILNGVRDEEDLDKSGTHHKWEENEYVFDFNEGEPGCACCCHTWKQTEDVNRKPETNKKQEEGKIQFSNNKIYAKQFSDRLHAQFTKEALVLMEVKGRVFSGINTPTSIANAPLSSSSTGQAPLKNRTPRQQMTLRQYRAQMRNKQSSPKHLVP